MLDRDQDDEEAIRVLRPVSRTSRSRLLEDSSATSTPCPSFGHLPRPIQQETSHMHGIHGRESISTDEGPGPQVFRCWQCQEYPVPNNAGFGTYSRTPFLPSRH